MDRRRLVREYLCGQCESPLVDRIVVPYQPPRVVCARDVSHSGYILKTTAEIRRAQARADAFEVQHAYRDLFPLPEPTGTIDDLFERRT